MAETLEATGCICTIRFQEKELTENVYGGVCCHGQVEALIQDVFDLLHIWRCVGR